MVPITLNPHRMYQFIEYYTRSPVVFFEWQAITAISAWHNLLPVDGVMDVRGIVSVWSMGNNANCTHSNKEQSIKMNSIISTIPNAFENEYINEKFSLIHYWCLFVYIHFITLDISMIIKAVWSITIAKTSGYVSCTPAFSLIFNAICSYRQAKIKKQTDPLKVVPNIEERHCISISPIS